jgi:hypothetical protein
VAATANLETTLLPTLLPKDDAGNNYIHLPNANWKLQAATSVAAASDNDFTITAQGHHAS